MSEEAHRKRARQAEYRLQLVEAELNAVQRSRAYQLTKKAGVIKKQLSENPLGLTKRAVKRISKNPKKALHMFRSVSRGAQATIRASKDTLRYHEWIILNEPDKQALDEQHELAAALSYRPMISIITPVFNPPADVFEDLIESVLDQTYDNFELCLGNFGDSAEIKQLIQRYARADSRVRYLPFTKNLGIAGNSNQILEKVQGEFIALLDHDDTLSPDALYENVKLLNEQAYDFIYSDKDKIDEKGMRFDPLFKPGFSPEMMLNVNYLTHLNVMRTALVREIGGWDPETDGAQDWDLFLRIMSKTDRIGFIPKILYHWRVIATSTALSIDTKPYALANQRKAVDKYLQEKSIPAKSYTDKTELLLAWDLLPVNRRPVVCIRYGSAAHAKRAIRSVRLAAEDPEIVLLVPAGDAQGVAAAFGGDGGVTVMETSAHGLGAELKAYLERTERPADQRLFFMEDSLRPPPHQPDWYRKLVGWLGVGGVVAAGGRIVNEKDIVYASGGLVNREGTYLPLFLGLPRFAQTYIGNVEWVRNLSALSTLYFATTVGAWCAADFTGSENAYDQFFAHAQKHGRLVMSPAAVLISWKDNVVDGERDMAAGLPKHWNDPYLNPNLDQRNPLALFNDEADDGEGPAAQPIDPYQHDAIILAGTFDITAAEMRAAAKASPANGPAKSVAFFLPSFDAVYAGLANIFTFATYLAEQKGVNVIAYILTGANDADAEKALASKAVPGVEGITFKPLKPDQSNMNGHHGIGIATQWATAYPLAKASNITRKYYFIQDNEVNFYPKGTISALVEQTYLFGFTAIAGTAGLLDMYRRQYGGNGLVLGSKVDLSAYHPRKDMFYVPQKPYRVFFYARPNMPRNAFELGIAALKKLKTELGDDVEIVTAGASWDEEAYGVGGFFTNLGKIPYHDVPKLYRSVDAGLMFMFSGHPGVTASELMASGCPVVVNEYDDITWHDLYQHEKTCLVTKPTASETALNLRRCLEEQPLRATLIKNGLEKVRNFYGGYEKTLHVVCDEILSKPSSSEK